MITVSALTKRYGSTIAVQDVSFTCEPGTITGFLGPNGAGKSTTLRMLTGLTRPDSGSALVAGKSYRTLPNPTRVVGSLLDASAQHDGRTGRATLRIAADLAGVSPRRVGETLEAVGLAGAPANRRIGTYSLGMRQRIGLAQALLTEPSILILDEPANGLDPEGIAWMRRLLRGFADDGGTVLLSSHLLAEVEATVDRLVVIGGGRIVAQGTLAELLVSAGLIVRAADSDRQALRDLLGSNRVLFTEREDGSLAVETADGFDAERLARLALEAGVVITELRSSDRAGLEELFFALTGNGNDNLDGAAA